MYKILNAAGPFPVDYFRQILFSHNCGDLH